MITIEKYNKSYKKQWNSFIANAINSSFLFQRDFMDYHQDRFEDYSLLAFKGEKLLAVLPANKVGETVYSHQGLSYGGLLINTLYLQDYFEILTTIIQYLNDNKIEHLQLNPIPHIYHKSLSEEINYATFLLKATRNRSDAYFVVNPKDYNINRNRKRALKVAIANELVFIESLDYVKFWEILSSNLQNRFATKPTHSLSEISLLARRFPENIKLFEVRKELKVLAGAVVFLVNDVAHIQYSSADETREETGSMDFLFNEILSYYHDKKWVSFGISGEEQGRFLNKGLVYWKQSFGASVTVQNFYEIPTANYKLLKEVFR